MSSFASAFGPVRRPGTLAAGALVVGGLVCSSLGVSGCSSDTPPEAESAHAAPERLTLGAQVTCRSGAEPICTGSPHFQVPTPIEPLAEAHDLAFGLRHGCLIDGDGAVRCWGDGLDGQLGVEPQSLLERELGRPARAAAASVPGAPLLESLAAGWLHTCGLEAGGSVVCWGDNARRQLGRPGPDPSAQPVVGLTGDTIALAAGGLHTCGLDSAGQVTCWGDGSEGQLGDGEAEDSSAPVIVTLPGVATGITAGAYHTCARLEDGSVACWGDNRFGQLGDGSKERRLVATLVSGLAGPAESVVAGASFTCALLAKGSTSSGEGASPGDVQCWGSDEFGESGRPPVSSGSSLDERLTPQDPVALPGPARAIHAAGLHACAELASGEVYCWGGNESGQLGDGTVTGRPEPVRWQGLQPDLPRPEVAGLAPSTSGIDVSYHSGFVDWGAARAKDYRFGLTLATAGVDFRDPFLAAHWERIRQAGLVRGAYHYYVAEDDPTEQAHHFLSHVLLEPGDLRPVIDIEAAKQAIEPALLAEQLREFVAEIERTIGVEPIIYTGPIFWRDHVASSEFEEFPLWIAEYEVDEPQVPHGWSAWSLWQWKGDADLSDIAPVVDLNRLHRDAVVADLVVPQVGVQHSPATPESP